MQFTIKAGIERSCRHMSAAKLPKQNSVSFQGASTNILMCHLVGLPACAVQNSACRMIHCFLHCAEYFLYC